MIYNIKWLICQLIDYKYNLYMRLNVREQVKALIAQENIKLKELGELLTKKTGNKYEASNFSHRLGRGTVTYNEVMTIAEILGYDVQFIKEK